MMPDSVNPAQQGVNDYRNPAGLRHFDFVVGWIRDSSTAVIVD
jgi:hypothetical protein